MKNIQNLKRLTKDQLITQLQNKDNVVNKNKSTESKSNNSLFQKIVEIILLLKSIILKITLIALIERKRGCEGDSFMSWVADRDLSNWWRAVSG